MPLGVITGRAITCTLLPSGMTLLVADALGLALLAISGA